MGCTAGAKIFDGGKKVAIFKNKDFGIKNYSDKLSFQNGKALGVLGVNLDTMETSGFSIGINHHGLIAMNTNVLTTSDKPYDLITERIVLEAKTIDEAVQICEQMLQGSHHYQWCNMIIATPKEIAAIELSSSSLSVEKSNEFLVRTNHHLQLNTKKDLINNDPKLGNLRIKNSEIRLINASEILKTIDTPKDIGLLIRSHNPIEYPICRHGQNDAHNLALYTVYSYLAVIQVDEQIQYSLDVMKGPPCKHTFTHLEIEFPITDERKTRIKEKYPF